MSVILPGIWQARSLGGASPEAILTHLPARQEGGSLSRERLPRTGCHVPPCSGGTRTSAGPLRAEAAAIKPLRCILGSALL